MKYVRNSEINTITIHRSNGENETFTYLDLAVKATPEGVDVKGYL
jgi:hypothetical protein